MADPNNEKEKTKKPNAIVAFFRSTRAELKKVRWPTPQQGWKMTKIVLVVTLAMAIFLGALDFGFGKILQEVVNGSILFIVLGVVIVLVLLAGAYLISRSEEA